MAACAAQLGGWGVSRQYAGGDLPVPGVYGVPAQWPHVAGLYQRAGFSHTGQTEVVYLARVEDLPDPADCRSRDWRCGGRWGSTAVGLSAVLGPEVTGYIEVEIQAAGWLRLAEVSRLLTYAWLEGTDPGGLNYDAYRAFLPTTGFRELTRTARGWTRG